MKKLLQIPFLLLLALGLFSACSDDNENNNNNNTEVLTLTVASVKRTDFTLGSGFFPYYVKYEGKTNWENYQIINGFKHEDGYEYVILVKSEPHDDPMLRTTFITPRNVTLLEIISKTKKETENIPLQGGTLLIASQKTGDEVYPYYTANYNLAINSEKWVKIPKIEGFEYEEGYEYEIEVVCEYVGVNTFPKYSYTYLKTRSKVKKDSEGLPN